MGLSSVNKLYYLVRPLLPKKIQMSFRRIVLSPNKELYKDIWPISLGSEKEPANWKGWPDNKKFALVLTHDVEGSDGYNKCLELASIEEKLGVKSAFYFVPERYNVSAQVRKQLNERGFEVGVHGLKHDGKLYFSKRIFKKRAIRINQYIKEWQAEGFRSPAMHHNLEWIKELDIHYDASTFDTDPFEPQPDGVNTIFPFYVKDENKRKGYVELPYTLPQDSTLYLLLREQNINIWKQKADWVAENGGCILFITHPDYMNLDNNPVENEYPVAFYTDFLKYIISTYKGKYWPVLPKELSKFWYSNCIVNKTK